jgi:hypothetical protein
LTALSVKIAVWGVSSAVFPVAGDPWIRKHRQEGVVYIVCLLFADLLFLVRDDFSTGWFNPGVVDHFGEVVLHRFSDAGIGDGAMLYKLPVLVAIVAYAVKISQVGVELIIAQFKIDVLQDQQAGGHADRETDDVDEGKDLVLADVSPCGKKIAPEHSFGDCLSPKSWQ